MVIVRRKVEKKEQKRTKLINMNEKENHYFHLEFNFTFANAQLNYFRVEDDYYIIINILVNFSIL